MEIGTQGKYSYLSFGANSEFDATTQAMYYEDLAKHRDMKHIANDFKNKNAGVNVTFAVTGETVFPVRTNPNGFKFHIITATNQSNGKTKSFLIRKEDGVGLRMGMVLEKLLKNTGFWSKKRHRILFK